MKSYQELSMLGKILAWSFTILGAVMAITSLVCISIHNLVICRL